MLESIEADCGPLVLKWGFSGKKYGYAIKLERKR
jgi:hypothetical protein